MPSENGSPLVKKLCQTLTASALVVSAMLSTGCLGLSQERMLPDPRIPHQVAETTEAVVWVRRPDGSLVKETVRVQSGWWIASPQAVQ